MITLDQIKQLDHKVRKAVDKINGLKNENNMLQEKLDSYHLRIEELEVLIDTFKEDQGEIESGIIDALNQLDILEDNIVLPEVDSELAQESTEPAQESSDQPSEDSEIKEETTAVIDESINTEEDDDSNGEESEPTDNSENKESELDIF